MKFIQLLEDRMEDVLKKDSKIIGKTVKSNQPIYLHKGMVWMKAIGDHSYRTYGELKPYIDQYKKSPFTQKNYSINKEYL